MVDFAALRKQSQSKNSFEKLNAELAKLNPKSQTYADDSADYWYPEVDKLGNAEAQLRFLPAPPNEEIPFVRLFNHGFQGPTGTWYIENSLTTIGKPDPVSEFNSSLWNAGDEASKEQARKQKRKLTYVANVYIIKEKLKPENEGKVFKFKFGKKIFDKLNNAMNPEFEGDDAMNPFDLWKGANFRLRIKKVDGYRNYDASKFDEPSKFMESDDEMEKVWNQTKSLQELIAPDKFKSYDELKARLHRVLALDTPAIKVGSSSKVGGTSPWPPWKDEPADKIMAKPIRGSSAAPDMESEDDDLAAFKDLIDE